MEPTQVLPTDVCVEIAKQAGDAATFCAVTSLNKEIWAACSRVYEAEKYFHQYGKYKEMGRSFNSTLTYYEWFDMINWASSRIVNEGAQKFIILRASEEATPPLPAASELVDPRCIEELFLYQKKKVKNCQTVIGKLRSGWYFKLLLFSKGTGLYRSFRMSIWISRNWDTFIKQGLDQTDLQCIETLHAEWAERDARLDAELSSV